MRRQPHGFVCDGSHLPCHGKAHGEQHTPRTHLESTSAPGSVYDASASATNLSNRFSPACRTTWRRSAVHVGQRLGAVRTFGSRNEGCAFRKRRCNAAWYLVTAPTQDLFTTQQSGR